MTIPERFAWMAEILEITPDDRLLEIGCGAGLAVAQIAPALSGGSITAIDRSRPMLSKAISRNEKYVKEKTVRFFLADLSDFDEGGYAYNKIFAFNVNLFWTKDSIGREMDVIKDNLTKRGCLYLFYQPPSVARMNALGKRVTENLQRNGCQVMEIMYEKSVASCCIRSRVVTA